MASASVPPPPQDSLLEPFLFSQQLGNDSKGHFDGGPFTYNSSRQQQRLDITRHNSARSSLHFTTKSTPKPQKSTPHSTASWGAPGDGFTGTLGPENSEPLQRVPYTPALERSVGRADQEGRIPTTVERRLNFSFDAPEEPSSRGHISLRPVTEIPEKYRSVFNEFPFFNLVQSTVFDDVLYTDLPLVTSAPTGSGKTVIFELAIVRLLQQMGQHISTTKIVYVAPMKALCSERYSDWQTKFGPLGLRCCELTGDSQLDDYFELQSAQIVMTTPEKWDSMTRKWRDHKSLVQLVRLFLIDEVHQLNDEVRGPTMEAIVSRMKTIRAATMTTECGGGGGGSEGVLVGEGGRGGGGGLRFIAVSATIPNIADLCCWLGSENAPALECKIDECHRPVRLRKVVLSYPSSSSDFKFNLSLNYRISGVIHTYSDQKPSLVFCATRKGTQQAAATLVKDARFVMNSDHKRRLHTSATLLRDNKLRDLVVYGVGYHHAGMDMSDRKAIEAMFTSGDLPVLFSTSTLAMGVNLPAHLVVVKSTSHYVQGMFQEYTESQVLQMIGRAGRPQFDTTATAVIMTGHSNKMKYEALLGGKQMIESCLHHNLIEHLNAEIVLHTITDVSIALEWLHSTFFYIRVKQNPKHYNIPEQKDELERKLQELLVKDLNLLEKHSLISMEDGFVLQPTDTGRLMARYCVAFKSMQCFLGLRGSEQVEELVGVVSRCQEFADVHLRVSEKRVLNMLNKDKNRATIRFPMTGKIKSKDMKVNCLLQATLGCLPVQEFSLNQDTQKIFRSASRLSKCLLELKMLGGGFTALLNSALLHKCIQARLWENSKHVAKQLEKIGLTISTTLVNAGLTTFDKIHSTNPRELELIVNRHPPFGTQIRDAVSKLPKYAISVEQSGGYSSQQAQLIVTISLTNHSLFSEAGEPTLGHNHTCMLLVGDSADSILCKQRVRDSQLLGSGQFSRKLTVHRTPAADEVRVHYISMEYVGLDVQQVFSPRYTGVLPLKREYVLGSPPHTQSGQTYRGGGIKPSSADERSGTRPGKKLLPREGRRQCNHRCINKDICGHDCCRNGLAVKKNSRTDTAANSTNTKPRPLPGPDSARSTVRRKREQPSAMTSFLSDLHARTSSIPETPALKRIKPALSTDYQGAYSPATALSNSSPPPPPSPSPPISNLRTRFSYTPSGARRMEKCGTVQETHSRLLDQIYEGRNDLVSTERGRPALFQTARLAEQQSANSIYRPPSSSSNALGESGLWDSEAEMRDFEDYIWEESESTGFDDRGVGEAVNSRQDSESNGGRWCREVPPAQSRGPTSGTRVGRPSPAEHTSHKLPPNLARPNSGPSPCTRPRREDYSEKTSHHFKRPSTSLATSSQRLVSTQSLPTSLSSSNTASSAGNRVIPHKSPYSSEVLSDPPKFPLPQSQNRDSACSFFTAGPVNAPEEDGSDLFGSVFAGIF